MKRIVLVALAALITVLGIGLVAAGALGIRVFGTSGSTSVTLDQSQTREGSVALVADIIAADSGLPFADQLGEVSLGATSLTAKSIFVGVGVQSDVDEFLFGLPYDVLHNDNGQWLEIAVPGVTQDAKPPQSEDIWVASDVGASADIPIQRTSADARTMVIMNADGTQNVAVDLVVGFESSRVFPLSIASIALGVALVATGLPGLFRWGRRRESELVSA